jgi:hypothetical protein
MGGFLGAPLFSKIEEFLQGRSDRLFCLKTRPTLYGKRPTLRTTPYKIVPSKTFVTPGTIARTISTQQTSVSICEGEGRTSQSARSTPEHPFHTCPGVLPSLTVRRTRSTSISRRGSSTPWIGGRCARRRQSPFTIRGFEDTGGFTATRRRWDLWIVDRW